MDKKIGQLLDDRYEILDILGTGGMAIVYKALCHRLNRLVAVKVLKDDYQTDEEFKRRFQAESRAIAILNHANIVSVYDISSGGELDYIVMELIDGLTLREYVTRRGRISWQETLHFSTQIARALEHAHSRGVIHRDIKPQNVMVLKDGSLKVADFGIAQLASVHNTLTREALGSVHYISPEQAKGSGTDRRTDIYSLGVVMYELLTGELPYDGETPVSIAISHINGGAKPPREIRPSIPVGLEQIVMKAMAPDPNDRFSTAEELADALEAFRKDPGMTFPTGDLSENDKPAAEKLPDRSAEEKKASAPKGTKNAEITPTPRRKNSASSGDRRGKEEKKSDTSGLPVLIGIVCILLLLFGVGWMLYHLILRNDLFGLGSVEVPSLLGESVYELQPDEYPELSLVIGQYVYDPSEKGTVVAQDPEPDTSVRKNNNTVTLTVSLGTRTDPLPDVSGDAEADARLLLSALGMELNFQTSEEYSDTVPVGHVIRTEPAAQSTVAEGDTVTLVISLGEEVPMVAIPDLTGYTLERAEAVLTQMGLSLSHAVETDSSEEIGTVVDQTPEIETAVPKGTRITLYVSGPIPDSYNGAAQITDESPAEEYTASPDSEASQTQTSDLTETDRTTDAAGTNVSRSNTQQSTAATDQTVGALDPSDEALPEEVPELLFTEEDFPSSDEEQDAAPEQESDLQQENAVPARRSTQTVTIELPDTEDIVTVTLNLDGVQVGRYSVEGTDGTLVCSVAGTGTEQLDIYFDGELARSQMLTFGE